MCFVRVWGWLCFLGLGRVLLSGDVRRRVPVWREWDEPTWRAESQHEKNKESYQLDKKQEREKGGREIREGEKEKKGGERREKREREREREKRREREREEKRMPFIRLCVGKPIWKP